MLGPILPGEDPQLIRAIPSPIPSSLTLPSPVMTIIHAKNSNDCEAARELELYATNVEAWIKPVIKTLSKKHRAGNFDLDRAIAYIDRYCLIPAAKQYRLEFCGMTDRWDAIFPKSVRLVAAESIARSWITEFRLGNYWD